MISQKMLDEINAQIIREWWSGFLYKSMEAFFQAEELPGFANWMNVQTLEEMAHGEIMFRYLASVGAPIKLAQIDAPYSAYKTPREAIEYGLDHEKKVTAWIHNLMDIANADNDHRSQIMLQWFVTEQIEEENNFSLLLKKTKLVEGDGRGLLILDQELSARVFTPPAILAAKGA